MKKIEINEKVYELPTGWGEVTPATFRRIFKYKDKINENTPIMSIVLFAAALLNIKETEIYNLDKSYFMEIADALSFLNKKIVPKKYRKKYIEIGGEKYFIKKDYKKLTVGEMISFEITTQDKDNYYDLIAPSLAVLIREKEGDRFDAKKYEKYIPLIETKLDMQTITDITNSFFPGGLTYTTTNSQTYGQVKVGNKSTRKN